MFATNGNYYDMMFADSLWTNVAHDMTRPAARKVWTGRTESPIEEYFAAAETMIPRVIKLMGRRLPAEVRHDMREVVRENRWGTQNKKVAAMTLAELRKAFPMMFCVIDGAVLADRLAETEAKFAQEVASDCA